MIEQGRHLPPHFLFSALGNKTVCHTAIGNRRRGRPAAKEEMRNEQENGTEIHGRRADDDFCVYGFGKWRRCYGGLYAGTSGSLDAG